jgi:hypothetical protein
MRASSMTLLPSQSSHVGDLGALVRDVVFQPSEPSYQAPFGHVGIDADPGFPAGGVSALPIRQARSSDDAHRLVASPPLERRSSCPPTTEDLGYPSDYVLVNAFGHDTYRTPSQPPAAFFPSPEVTMHSTGLSEDTPGGPSPADESSHPRGPDGPRKRFRCTEPGCSVSYTAKRNLEGLATISRCSQQQLMNPSGHRDSVHRHAVRYTCSICQQGFARPSDGKRHEKSHDPNSHPSCPVCGKVVSRSDVLKKHLDSPCSRLDALISSCVS